MLSDNRRLLEFRHNVHSQNGEDGVLEEIHRRLKIEVDDDYWVVEFGSWDGKHLSNTFHLVEKYGAKAVYIEGDREKFRRLQETSNQFPSIKPVEAFVIGEAPQTDLLATPAFTGTYDPSSIGQLDDILQATDLPRDYDLLSIDIDSFDLEVWSCHKLYGPKIVIIEINSLIPPGILQWHGKGRSGNSFSATLKVATLKGYTLVCHTGNLIFLRNDLVNKIGISSLDLDFPERLFDYSYLRP